MRFSHFALPFAFALSAGAFAQAPADEAQFTPEGFRAHVAFLADDRLEGRDAGTPGYELGALYVATRFEGLGLKPVGKDGWFQQVPFLEYKLGGNAPRLTIGDRRFEQGREILLAPTAEQGPINLEAPVVFAGYGLESPELGLDDYKGLDVRGKIVALFGGYPKGIRSDVGAHLNADKRRLAAKHGAVGVIMLRSRAESELRPFARAIRFAREPGLTWLGEGDVPYSGAPGLRFRATLDTPAAQALFAGSRRSFTRLLDDAAKGRRLKGFALKSRVRVEQGSETRRLTSPNVLAVLPGSDPALAGEYVLLMAHLDGLGLDDGKDAKDAKDGDLVNNGAMDNATGVATLIEVARAMIESGERPKRSILFAAVTAEEHGLLGAQYLARHPVTGSGRIVGVVNLDMPVLLYDFKDVIAFGAEHSTMGPSVARAAERMGVTLSADPLPQEGLFTRSDHYRFVQEGIPAVFLMTGFENGGREKFTDFLATHYHKPSDDLKLPIDWRAAAKFARINYLIAREIADAPEAPLWYDDSFFGSALAPGQAKAARPKD
jgi:hypothetical protein